MSEEQKIRLEPIARMVPNLCLGFKEVQGLYDSLNRILNYEAHPSFCDHVHKYANEALSNFKLLKKSLEEISGGIRD